VFRESTRDFFVNRGDRTDCWIKSPQALAPEERERLLRGMRFIRTREVADADLLVYGALGETALSRSIVQPLIEAMPVGEIVDMQTVLAGQPAGRDLDATASDLALLASRRLVEPVPAGQVPGEAERASCHALNVALTRLSAAGEDIGTVASPVLAGGFGVAESDRQFLAGWLDGLRTPAELAGTAEAWQASRCAGRADAGRPQHRGHTLLAEAEIFLAEAAPVLQALDVT
jgi:hypothetical protein